jgi:hypothetical protein
VQSENFMQKDIDFLLTFSLNMYIPRTWNVAMQRLVHLLSQETAGSGDVGMLSQMLLWVAFLGLREDARIVPFHIVLPICHCVIYALDTKMALNKQKKNCIHFIVTCRPISRGHAVA